MTLKLGKRPATHDPRDLRLERYVSAALKPPGADTGNVRNIDWGVLGNDRVGDCVFAGADHETILWTLEAGRQAAFTTDNALADYSAVTGYNPADPNTDQGTVVRDALKYRQATGLIDNANRRHKLGAYVAVTPGDRTRIKQAVHWFDAVGIGFEFPSSAMSQFHRGKAWTVVPGSRIEGGHYVPVVGYTSQSLWCVTWGRLQRMSWGFFAEYCDEAYALLSEEMLVNGVSPDGLDLEQLRADLQAVRS